MEYTLQCIHDVESRCQLHDPDIDQELECDDEALCKRDGDCCMYETEY